MSIAGKTLEKEVTPDDNHASFTLDLEKGPAQLDTALLGDKLKGAAYFVTVEFNE